jgi:hypothetical protein
LHEEENAKLYDLAMDAVHQYAQTTCYASHPNPAEPGKNPQPDPQPYKDPVQEPPFDPPDERPLIDPQPPNTDLPRM